MTLTDQPALANLLQEVCAIYDRAFSDVLVSGYYRALKAQSLEAINKAVLRILTDESRRQVMPPAAEIKAIARHLEREGGEQRYLPCQRQGCEALVAWPPVGTVTEHRAYCPRHVPRFEPDWPAEKHLANRVTPDEKREMAGRLTPKGMAFLRSVMPPLLSEIPMTDAERAAAEAMDAPRRAMAFKDSAEGPGVSPGVFLTHANLLDGFPEDYRQRREIVAAGGWRYDIEQGYWHKGKRRLSDAQIDGIADLEVLEDFVYGRR